jgi:VIT1/CCC1 family predicted Fe2+/Mn2+ transporter
MTGPDTLEHDHSPQEIARRLHQGPEASYLRDWVYGGIDGAVTTFAIVAGALGADLSTRYVIIMGIANLVADGFSMAAANYTGTKAENDEFDRIREMEERHVELHPDGEREEIRQIYASKGFDGDDLDDLVRIITKKRQHWIDVMMAEEHGLALGDRSAARAALATFAAFVVCGAVPLIPFVMSLSGAAIWATLATGVTFFGIGAIKARWSLTAWWRSGLETCAIGMAAAGMAYLLGEGLAKLI